ncbi:FUT7 (predicted) [Pycnogonum litorale]
MNVIMMKLMRYVAVVACSTVLLCWITTFLERNDSHYREQFCLQIRKAASISENSHIILFWLDTLFNLSAGQLNSLNVTRTCRHQNCYFSFNKHLQTCATAVIFKWDDVIDDTVLPKKYDDQIWIFMAFESPVTDIHLRGDKRFQKFNYLLNWTMSYRRDSDIFTPYYRLKPESVSKRRKFPKVMNKTKMAAWFVSNHYNTFSSRDAIVRQLQQHGVSVDIFGDDENLKCPNDQENDCMAMLERDYKFYLSFENSICKDYITEKFFKVLPYDVVPVVLGGGDYSNVVPSSSYIDVTSFPSTENLAQYLKLLDRREDLYVKYLEWKRYFTIEIEDMLFYMFCDICDKINKDNRLKTYENIKDWWVRDECFSEHENFTRKLINERFYGET